MRDTKRLSFGPSSKRFETTPTFLTALSCYSMRALEQEVLPEDLVRARFEIYSDTLRGRVAPVFAAIVSSATVVSGQAVQREAAAAGIRVALFLDSQSARQWLSSCAPGSGGV